MSKSAVLQIRLTPEEKARWCAEAAEREMSVSDLIRFKMNPAAVRMADMMEISLEVAETRFHEGQIKAFETDDLVLTPSFPQPRGIVKDIMKQREIMKTMEPFHESHSEDTGKSGG